MEERNIKLLDPKDFTPEGLLEQRKRNVRSWAEAYAKSIRNSKLRIIARVCERMKGKD